MIIEQAKTKEIIQLFEPREGLINCYYGKVRNGKTYAATADILKLLDSGQIVFANWYVNWEGKDERKDKILVLGKILFGRKLFFVYGKENFQYFAPDMAPAETVRMLNKLVGVHIFIDEGQWILNSHVRNPDPEAQRLILTNGHYCRSLNIITQRPTNVFVDMRSQVHRWHKCEKIWRYPLRFKRTIIEDMKDNVPDEDEEKMKKYPRKYYWATKRVKNAYNTHAFRGADAIQPENCFHVYKISTSSKIKLLFQTTKQKMADHKQNNYLQALSTNAQPPRAN